MYGVLACWLTALLAMPWPALSSSEIGPQAILVVGGAGYIGSHVNAMLHQRGYETVVLDNLSSGHRGAVQEGIFIEGDSADKSVLDTIFSTYSIKAVMHFAAFKDVGESVSNPLKYYYNNVAATLNLLAAMERHKVRCFIFSSTAAIFGSPLMPCITEEHPTEPLNPYGRSKLLVEKILPDLEAAYGLRYCCLRYFNAAGGDPCGIRKDYTTHASNLIPIVLLCLQNNLPITIFGTDYPTEDGTCIRDYIHIEDLGEAHILAMEKLLSGAACGCYNLGNGRGFSVQEVIHTAEEVTGKPATVITGPRRPGDASTVVACSKKAKRELGWQPKYSSLQTMLQHTWQSMQQTLKK